MIADRWIVRSTVAAGRCARTDFGLTHEQDCLVVYSVSIVIRIQELLLFLA
jgi:hypothetical protein